MIDENGDAQMRVPGDIAKKLDKVAEKKGISGRGRWAIFARMILAEAVAQEVT